MEQEQVKLSASIGLEVGDLIARKVDNGRNGRLTAEQIRNNVNANVLAPLQCKYKNGKHVHSSYIRAYAFGYYMSEVKRIMREEVEFCYELEGELYSTDRNTTHRSTEELYKAKRGQELLDVPGYFYWLGTNKRYT